MVIPERAGGSPPQACFFPSLLPSRLGVKSLSHTNCFNKHRHCIDASESYNLAFRQKHSHNVVRNSTCNKWKEGNASWIDQTGILIQAMIPIRLGISAGAPWIHSFPSALAFQKAASECVPDAGGDNAVLSYPLHNLRNL
jgi:hypothetical protein